LPLKSGTEFDPQVAGISFHQATGEFVLLGCLQTGNPAIALGRIMRAGADVRTRLGGDLHQIAIDFQEVRQRTTPSEADLGVNPLSRSAPDSFGI
jgi:hypothetical protein